MTQDSTREVEQTILDRYQQRTPRSRELLAEAKNWLPGGDTRSINFYSPYPTYMERGEGCYLYDFDGNRYLDCLNNYSTWVHGHSHPALVAATIEQLHKGTSLGAPSILELRHAELLSLRVPSVKKVRYCNSGTEATMFAIKTARAFTGRDAIIKIDGGYHGTHNCVQVNMFVGMSEPPQKQSALPAGFPYAQVPQGVPMSVLRDVMIVPFNDLAAVETILAQHGPRIAALIVEPMLGAGGGIPAAEGYLRGLRELTRRHGVLLIFDECVTFRVGPLQTTYNVDPDLTTLSKIIGGGFPMGAFGGRDDIMAMYDPTGPNPMYHSGAFCANNMSLAAGIAGIKAFGPDEVARLNQLGERLMTEMTATARRLGIKGQAIGLGSYGHFHWGEGSLRNAQDVHARKRGLGELPALFHLELMNRGVFISRRSLFSLSTPMTDAHIDAFIDAFKATLEVLKPYIEEAVPHLLETAQRIQD